MKITRKNMERLAKNVGYCPEEIGISILRSLGYEVKTYIMLTSVYVSSKDGKKIIYHHN